MFASVLALAPAFALAAEIVSGEDVTISSPVADDVYVFGARITIDADIDGDVIATAAEVSINGNVTGSVYLAAFSVDIRGDVGGVAMVTASDVTISGDVGGSVRVIASTVEIDSSTIGGDLVGAVTDVEMDDASTVRGDVVLRASSAELDGDVGGEIRGTVESLEVGGAVGGPIDVHVGNLRFTEGARVTQPVRYTSEREVLVDGGTFVTGELTRVEPDHPTLGERILSEAVWAVFRYVWALALGVFLLRVAPRLVRRSAEIIRQRPFSALGWGVLGIIGVPLAIVALMITVVGLPVALVVLAGFILALYASQIVVAMIVGQYLAPRAWRTSERFGHSVGVLAIGLFVIVVVRSLPISGWGFVTGATIALAAIGALAMQIVRRDSGTAGAARATIG